MKSFKLRIGRGSLANKRWNILFLMPFVILSTSFVDKYHGAMEEIGVRTIVIDAGHGGKDPGCHGQSAHEKNVCLSIALKLGNFIEKNFDDVEVIYTRKTDVFVELHERARIANKNEADLFICIHANSGQSKASGAETYVMGLHKSEANLKVAERENSSILMEEGYKQNYQDFDGSPEAIIAMSITQAEYLKQSADFASKVQKQFKALGRKDRGVKQAGFLVLYKTTMPSVLIETGFLTNAAEEKWLANDANQEKMANGIFKAFVAYKKEIESINNNINGTDVKKPKIKEAVIEENPTVSDASTTTVNTEKVYKHGIVFKVQIATSSTQVERKPENFKGITMVDEYISGGMYKYTVGRLASFEEAKELQGDLKETGYHGSFIVAFKDGLRMDLQEAIRLTRE